MGGSNVVHCVRVPLTGTTMAPFWMHLSVVWDWLDTVLSLYKLFVEMGPIYYCYVMGPRPSNVARGI